jgi:hypothetical protein
VPLVAAAFVTADHVGLGGAGPVGQQAQTAREVALNLKLALDTGVQRHVLEHRAVAAAASPTSNAVCSACATCLISGDAFSRRLGHLRPPCASAYRNAWCSQ